MWFCFAFDHVVEKKKLKDHTYFFYQILIVLKILFKIPWSLSA